MRTRFSRFLPFSTFLLSTLLFACPTTGDQQSSRNNHKNQFSVSKEVYDKTFDEILQFIKKIDELIKTSNYDQWKANLTADFMTRYSDQGFLMELSQKPYLKERNIILKSLHDYFINVFIPSRIENRLDKIEFIGENRVKAISVISDVPYIVYLLEKDENNQWKIGVW